MRTRTTAVTLGGLLTVALSTLGVGACSSESSGGTMAPDGGSADASVTGTNPIASLPSGWNEVRPGGRTACSDGSPFAFYVRPGKVDRVVFEMSGGGACWDTITCGFATQLFSANVDPAKLPWVATPAAGIYDHENADNPFRDWHHVFVPYCTGDIHWGDNVATYTDTLKVSHVGAVNVRAALDWVYANVVTTDKVMMTGCSAGGYGSIFWTPDARKHYGAGTKVYQFSDSAAGTITADFFSKIQVSWRFDKALPTYVAGLADASKVAKLSSLYTAIGAAYPEVPLAQFNTTYDETQSLFFTLLGGGDTTVWSTQMRSEIAAIAASTPSFRALTAPGFEHCILPRPELYTASYGGVRLVDWLAKEVAGEPVATFDCGTSCGAPK